MKKNLKPTEKNSSSNVWEMEYSEIEETLKEIILVQDSHSYMN